MSAGAPALPLGVDPLIAEAKARARRRRLIALGLIVAAAAGALAYGLLPSGRSAESGSSSLPTSLAGRLDIAIRDRVQVSLTGSAGGGVEYAQPRKGGDLWLTPNGGASWVEFTHGGWSGPGTTDFVNRRYGWVYELPAIYRTTDGGHSWTRLDVPKERDRGSSFRFPVEVNNLSFVNRTVGFFTALSLAGDHRDRVYSTHDGGVTWQPRGLLPAGAASYASFTNPRAGVVSVGADLYSTADGGLTWVRSPAGPCAGNLVGGRYGGTLQVWQCGASVHETTDGGSSWNLTRAPEGLKYIDALNAFTWVGGFAGSRFFVTTSAGRRWAVHRLPAPPHWTIPLFRFTSPTTGWAIFGHEPPGGHATLFGPLRGHQQQFQALVLMRTTDGGKHWTPAGPPKPHGQTHG